MTALEELMAKARAEYEAMTPAQRNALHREQRESYVRAEIALGSDADEAEYNEAILSGDQARIAECKRKESARLAAYDALIAQEADQ